jgi:hypothetical protein
MNQIVIALDRAAVFAERFDFLFVCAIEAGRPQPRMQSTAGTGFADPPGSFCRMKLNLHTPSAFCTAGVRMLPMPIRIAPSIAIFLDLHQS